MKKIIGRKKKMKKDQLKVFIVACLVVTVCAFGYATYAFFQTTYTAKVTGTLTASWTFDFLGADKGAAVDGLTSFKCTEGCANLGTADAKLAPGSKGSFTLKVDASTSTVATEAAITMYGLTNAPTGLVFKVGETTLDGTALTAPGAEVAKFDWPAEDAAKTNSVTVNWEWPYGDAADNSAQGKTVTFNLKAVATQK
jgi:hypothetical protein